MLFSGKIGIDLERKLVIHDDKDPEVWKPPKIDQDELMEAKKFAAPERKVSWAGLGWAGLGWAGLGWAGLGWAGLGWAGLGWVV